MKNYSGDQEFHLSITPVGENQYLFRTERVAPGVAMAEELVVWPIEIWLSQAALEPLLPLENSADIIARDWLYLDYQWQESGSAAELQSSSSTELAQQIYNILFQGTIRNSWLAAIEMASLSGDILQVRLIVKDKRLATLPWELVSIGEFLGKNEAEDGRNAYFDRFEASDSEDWEMEDGDLNNLENDEDTAFISGLLTQFSPPTSVQNNLANPISNPATSSSNESVPGPIASAQIVTPAKAADRQTINPKNLNKRPGNFINLFDRQKFLSPKKQLLWSLAFVLLSASTLLFARHRWLGWQSANYLPEVSSNTASSKALPQKPSLDINKLNNAKLAAVAVENFQQGDLENGQKIVETLLNRNALPQAKFALTAIPPNQKNKSAIDFLYGRLAWQSIRSGDKTYSVDDVRRYWENALKGQPTSPFYHNSLGFAYYAQGNITKANQAWFDGLYHAQAEQVAKTESDRRQNLEYSTPNSTKLTSSKDVLTAYAGLSLALWRSAQNQPADKRSRLMAKAIELSQKVMQDDPVNFHPEALQNNWLWTKQEVEDWRNLQKIKATGNGKSR